MRESTMKSIAMLAKADPECTDDVLSRLEAACKEKRGERGDLMTSAEARGLLRVSKVTMCKWVKGGKLHPVRLSRNLFRYNRNEIERLAYGE